MKKKSVIFIICVILSAIIPYGYSQTAEKEIPDTSVSIRIKWNEVRNAVRYRVLIRDSSGKLIIDRNAESNSIDLDITPGNYSMRIGAVNKFSKIGSWSDWAAFSVKEPEKPVEKPEPEPEKPGKTFTSFKIGAGASYFYLLPNFNENLDNSYMSGNLLLGYSPANLISLTFFRHTGFEIESTYVKIEGKTHGDERKINKTDKFAGGNIYFTTAFDFPVNFILRAGGGITYTELEYENIDPEGNNLILESQDPFYKVGASIEIAPARHFFIEAGADYCTILYIGDDFKSLIYFMRAGIKF